MGMGSDKLQELYLDDTSIERFHRNLSVLRKASGLSCKDMGDILGITRTTYSNIESVGGMSRIHYLAIHDVFMRVSEANKEIVNIIQKLITMIDIGTLTESDECQLQDLIAAVEKRTGKKLGSKTLGERIRAELYLWLVDRLYERS